MLVDAKIEEANTYVRSHGIEQFREHLRIRHAIDA
jgi:hypothetical protein